MALARLLRQASEEAPRPCDIGASAPGVRVSVLAERLHIAPRSVTEVADALEAAGLLARSPDPSDRRAVLLSLTDRGREIVDEALRSRREAAERAMSQLSSADRAELRRLLEALLADFPT